VTELQNNLELFIILNIRLCGVTDRRRLAGSLYHQRYSKRFPGGSRERIGEWRCQFAAPYRGGVHHVAGASLPTARLSCEVVEGPAWVRLYRTPVTTTTGD
jgi:hypothetical protein